ncbi:urokinase plasminogen activator surface receptor [Callorhinchus milii]|uniref:Urokinase plasminogen activator surface receptor-like n=1 Tax=Callorhinchus milii TaxID=7868 RepID=A0A4W3GIJ3_CALMI|nr:urokinase plasminogen activator surface receptor [Callorhinchus milii]XP_007910493.1 urokinase plasminogen activator surface receptor [Callorhinchus milii]XP_042201597.1 urokinase plasminogen activator surface receptor [Callorhinchus milii]|eukprot:gi/632986894/ref/XP_007910492.1/ PREDICTED: urokinase plasminogen activator surface receptor-like [Callorhinchus milii]
MKIFLCLLSFCAVVLQVHSLKCYSCENTASGCNHTCSSEDICSKDTTKTWFTQTGIEDGLKSWGCIPNEYCFGHVLLQTKLKVGITKRECCQTELCNKGVITVVIPDKKNGLRCWSCDNDNGENCAEPTITIDCVDIGTRCFTLYSNSTGIEQFMRGCASPSYCSIDPEIGTDFTCCGKDLCNASQNVRATIGTVWLAVLSLWLF